MDAQVKGCAQDQIQLVPTTLKLKINLFIG
jgi:hypothetical protein